MRQKLVSAEQFWASKDPMIYYCQHHSCQPCFHVFSQPLITEMVVRVKPGQLLFMTFVQNQNDDFTHWFERILGGNEAAWYLRA